LFNIISSGEKRMPIFDYRCQSCGYEVEIFQKSGDLAPDSCPECNAKGPLVQKVSAPSFRLSGGGWYETIEKPKDKQRNIAKSDSDSGPSGTKTTS
jgi:putative FmdB family regulatory protein